MIDEALVERTVDLLNELLEVDPVAVHQLVESRVSCSHALSWHPTVQVHGDGLTASVGILGVLNGLCGVDSDGWGAVAAVFEEDGTLSGFARVKPEWKQ